MGKSVNMPLRRVSHPPSPSSCVGLETKIHERRGCRQKNEKGRRRRRRRRRGGRLNCSKPAGARDAEALWCDSADAQGT